MKALAPDADGPRSPAHPQKLALWVVLAAALIGTSAGAVELRGHGGPVRALALDGDGRALSGSFDSTAILWDGASGVAQAVLRQHAGAVNAVAFLPDGGFVTGGQDGSVAFWRAGATLDRAVAAHGGPVAALAASPDGARLASAGWDAVARIHDPAAGEQIVLRGHDGPVNGVGFLPGGGLATAGYDGQLRFWDADGAPGPVVQFPAPLNALVVAPDGGVWVAGADGVLRLFGPAADARSEVATGAAPLSALAFADGIIAAGGVDGRITLVDAEARRITRAIEASAGPVWSLAIDATNGAVLAGGADNVVRGWDVATGAALSAIPEAVPAAALDDRRGARVFRACAACHTLGPDDGHRAGPTLHGLFGRRIASAAGYDYSPALRAMRLTWTPETVSALFDLGPSAYTPGTKMPEQRVPNTEDRAALIEFLQQETR